MTATELTRRRFGLGFTGVLSLLASGCLNSITGGDDHEHEHEHDDPPWERGGLYELDQGTYPYTYQDGPNPDMHLAIVPTDEDGDHGLFHAGETATELFENGEADTVSDGDTVQPSSETLYRVDFESEGETTIELEIESDGLYSLFTAHDPDEFDAALRSETGEELTPTVTEEHSSHSHDDESHSHDDEHEH
ncbi:hypothetical protein Htur_0263 [Haloterrigena turkmenica DSM 5511]|uniref:Uncharacterized protein n=1 Tax=Haloterrigena turkmenica (strain ATCC 51198 / DSM 5511 / JCM 9101 / NCIMB 13204 / VKM B-1734 / 4k) TaxID=543526 RepID=D2RU95_HALTV|nr:hypothetical protein [Haloterrigena turkmenica]ADB59164.1 hypothetical protein Htur_0263 [Haloterrigena turkmenica DSM 5511]